MFRDEGDDWLPEWGHEAIRLEQIVDLTHWTVQQIEATPAVTIDRLLMVHAAKERARASLMEDANRG